MTFFVGSLFFTTAGALQYLEVVNANPVAGVAESSERVRLLTWEPHRIDWWSSAVQLVGTLFFNVSTLAALLDGLGAENAAQLRLAAGRARLDLLPRRERARVGRGRAPLALVAPGEPVVVDRAA